MADEERESPSISEMLGGKPETAVASFGGETVAFTPVATDYTKLDYVAYDRLYHGRLPNFEIAGLFVKPIINHIVNFMFGNGITIAVNEPRQESTPDDSGMTTRSLSYTNELLSRWAVAAIGSFRQIGIEALKFGDFYTVVEEDGTLTHISPTNVNKVVDPISRKVTRFEIYTEVTELNNQNRAVQYVYRDTRTIKERVIERRLKSAPDRPSSWSRARIVTTNDLGEEITLPNPIPNAIQRFDIVHFANDRDASDLNGYSEVYSIITALRRYDDLMNWAITGNKLMGRPTPVFEGINNVKEFLELFGRDVQLPNGTKARVMDWRAEQVQVLGQGAAFRLVSPQPFASDTKTLLEVLFWIISQHTNIPEFVWGTAVSSSRASVSEQMPPFSKFISGKRQQFAGVPADPLLQTPARGGLHELTDIWLRKRKLRDSKVNIEAPTIITWPDLTDKEAELSRRVVEYLFSQGLITETTTLQILNNILGNVVPDLEEEIINARVERKARAAETNNGVQSGQVIAPNGTEPDGSPAPAPTTADGTASGPQNNEPGNNQFTGRN